MDERFFHLDGDGELWRLSFDGAALAWLDGVQAPREALAEQQRSVQLLARELEIMGSGPKYLSGK